MYANAQVDIRGNLTRRTVDLTSKKGYAFAVQKPFDPSFQGVKLTLSNCVYMRGPVRVIKTPTTNPYTITSADGDIFIGVKINTQSGDIEIIEGLTVDDVSDADIPTDVEFFKLLLFKIKKTTGSLGNSICTLIVDYRSMPMLGLYV